MSETTPVEQGNTAKAHQCGNFHGLRGQELWQQFRSGALCETTPGESSSDPPSIFSPRRWREVGVALGLTPRQLTIAQLLCSEFTTKAISEQLGISKNTVETHLKALYRRLGVQTRVGVIVQLVRADQVFAGPDATGLPLVSWRRPPVHANV